MDNWTPSIVPRAGDGQDFCLVIEDLGRLGRVFLEADIARADFETVIADMLDGQYGDPLRVVSFNTIEGWSRDISADVASEVRRRCELRGREIPASILYFVESHEGWSRQLTLRLGWTYRLAISARIVIFTTMRFDFCIPTRGAKVPNTPDWLHEIKYDGYRLRVERNGGRVRLFTRNGYDWTKRYPWIVESALKNRQKHFVIDGEAVILGVDGVSDFNALHSGRRNEEVQLYAFDMLAGDGDDMRSLPLAIRKANLARLLARRPDGIFVAPFEQGEIGPALFWAACNLGLEGLVSKRRDRPYRGGRSPNWIKVKNRTHPAMSRVRDSF